MSDVAIRSPDVASEILQGSAEWLAIRAGRATASRISDILAKAKNGDYRASRANYAAQLVAERLTGLSMDQDRFVSWEMKRGTELEAEARADYEWYRDVKVEQVGFFVHPTIEQAGASPDGTVGIDGLVEIKCPGTARHIDTLLRGKVDSDHVLQCQFQMASTGRKWVDWVSYDNRMPEHMRRFVVRIERNDIEIKRIETEVVLFLNDIAATVKLLKQRYPG